MAESIERVLERLRADQGTKRPRDVILVLCDRPEDVEARVDVLIRAGNLTEADRSRCVFCDERTFEALTHDERVFVWAANETVDDRRRLVAASAARARAALTETLRSEENGKSEMPSACRFVVNRL